MVKIDYLFSFRVGVVNTKQPKRHKAYFSSQFPVAVYPGGALQEPEAAGRIIPTTRRQHKECMRVGGSVSFLFPSPSREMAPPITPIISHRQD